MVVMTIPLNPRSKHGFSMFQCPECGNSVLTEVKAGLRGAVVCYNPEFYRTTHIDTYSRFHDWTLVSEAAVAA